MKDTVRGIAHLAPLPDRIEATVVVRQNTADDQLPLPARSRARQQTRDVGEVRWGRRLPSHGRAVGGGLVSIPGDDLRGFWGIVDMGRIRRERPQ